MADLRLQNYIFTEAELQKTLGGKLPDQFIKDYIASKANSTALLEAIDKNTVDIETIFADLVDINTELAGLDARVTTIEGDVAALQSDLTDHIADTETHGSTGDIVGNLDYASSSVGGVVLEAVAVADAGTATVTPPAALGAAGAAYVQAYAQSQTDAINTLITNVTDLRNFLNSAITVINSSLASERGAKQRAI